MLDDGLPLLELCEDPLLLGTLDELPLEPEDLPMLDELLPWLELDDGLPLLDDASEELPLELLPLELGEPELLLDGGDPEELLDPDEPLLEDGGGGGGAPLELEESLEPDPDELDDSDDIVSPFQRSDDLNSCPRKRSMQSNSAFPCGGPTTAPPHAT